MTPTPSSIIVVDAMGGDHAPGVVIDGARIVPSPTALRDRSPAL
jgi:hypothetical protein